MTDVLPLLAVCGFGRCGSSLLMQMLDAGGIPTTGEFPSFEDDRAGLGSFDTAWLKKNAGRAVKVLDPHKAPRINCDRIAIWIDRNPVEQAKSYAKFTNLVFGTPNTRALRHGLERSFRKERAEAMNAASLDRSRLFRTTFEHLVVTPKAALTVLGPWLADFGFNIDAEAAIKAVRPRGPKCLPNMLELDLIAETAG